MKYEQLINSSSQNNNKQHLVKSICKSVAEILVKALNARPINEVGQINLVKNEASVWGKRKKKPSLKQYNPETPSQIQV